MKLRNNDRLLAAIQTNNIYLLTTVVSESYDAETSDFLHYAAQLGSVEVLKILIDAGWRAQLNVFDEVSFTPLMWAAKNEHVNAVQFLLSVGAEVNAYDESACGNTVLREVVESCSLQIARTLVDYGANPHITGWMQLTAYDKALERVNENPNQLSQEIFKLISAINHTFPDK